jgi:hypothetical protein
MPQVFGSKKVFPTFLKGSILLLRVYRQMTYASSTGHDQRERGLEIRLQPWSAQAGRATTTKGTK